MMNRIAIGLLVFAVSCSGDDGSDDGPQYDLPQILPNPSPACVSLDKVAVGDSHAYTVLLTNEGRMPLLISGGEIVDDTNSSYRFDEIRKSASEPCNDAAPCALEFDEQAAARIFFEPTVEGWHDANLVVRSNAQNFPNIRIYVLGRARPMALGPNDPYDAGTKPATAEPGTADEACQE